MELEPVTAKRTSTSRIVQLYVEWKDKARLCSCACVCICHFWTDKSYACTHTNTQAQRLPT